MKFMYFLVLVLSIAASFIVKGETRHALVIGNSAYTHAASLANTVNDARAVADNLRELGFAVTFIQNATGAELRKLGEQYVKQASQAQTISVFYFSGHGLEIDGRNLAFGVDGSATDWLSSSLDIQQFLSTIQSKADSVNLVILDACREVPPPNARAGFPKGFRALDTSPGTLLAYATSPGQLASSISPDFGSLSLYTKYLVRELKAVAVPVEEVFKRIRLGVYAESGQYQLPWEHSSLTREYFFSPGAPSTRGWGNAKASDAELMPHSVLDEVHSLLARFPNASEETMRRLQTLLGDLTSIGFTSEEIQAMAITRYRSGVTLVPLAEYAQEILGVPPEGGLLVYSVAPGSIAHRLKVMEGDVLVSVNGKPVLGIKELSNLIDIELKHGSRLTAQLIRNRVPKKIEGVVSYSSIDELVMDAVSWNTERKNYGRAQQLATWAGNRGNSDANVLLANFAANGVGNRLAPDFGEMLQRAQAAVDAGNVRGKFWLMQASLRGWGVPKSYARANELRNEAAAEGAPWAIAGLGIAYLDGQGLPPDYEKARRFLEQGAALGHHDGMIGLGWLYERGLGVPRDLALARIWYERALQSQNIQAMAIARRALVRLN